MSETITVAEAVGRTLAALGVRRAFGVVGSGNFHVTNALVDRGAAFTAARHEMGAACMADAYARATGEPAVVSVHQGCGLSNALTGIGEAAKARTPIIVVAGDTPAYQPASNFFIDQDAAVRAFGAVAARIHRAETAVYDAFLAYTTAVVDRRTVVLSMPLDLQAKRVEWDDADLPELPVKAPAVASNESVARIVDAIGRSERPVILAGRGAWHAEGELQRLGALSGALLTTSAAGRGLFRRDPWHLDVMGGFATHGSADLVAEADLLLVFGAALNRWTTLGGSLLKGKTVIQVDDTREAIGLHYPVTAGVLGDTALTASAVAAALEAEGAPEAARYRDAERAERIRASLHWRDQDFDEVSEPGKIDPRTLTIALDDAVPEERVVVPDGGNFNGYPGAFFRVPDARGYSVPLAFQSIGLALSSGIGAALANPGRVPVVGIGDGGFMMSHVELDTAVRLGIGLLVVVYNDSAYGAEVQHFKHETDRLEIVSFPETDIAAIARGYGCEGITVTREDDLAPVADWLAGPRDRPLVIDAKIAAFPSWLLEHAMDEN